MTASLGIDHALVCVNDIKATREIYLSLGFVSRGFSQHPWGTSTTLLIFKDQLFEIVGIGEPVELEIMVPLVSLRTELDYVKGVIDRVADDVLAQAHREHRLALVVDLRPEDLAEPDRLALGVGQLQRHVVLARDGLDHPDGHQRQRTRQVLGQVHHDLAKPSCITSNEAWLRAQIRRQVNLLLGELELHRLGQVRHLAARERRIGQQLDHSALELPHVGPAVARNEAQHFIRENQLVGYGLVVGLNGTGDSLNNAPFTKQSLQSMLERLGVNIRGQTLRTGNVAAVMVTAQLPAFAQAGQQIDVTVSSIGNAKSLRGGTLLLTPLHTGYQFVFAAFGITFGRSPCAPVPQP